jgi:hypothetical protein
LGRQGLSQRLIFGTFGDLNYHLPMRRSLLIFMLFLLPIRALMGDAMAYSMLPAAAQAASSAQQSTPDLGAAHATFYWASSLFEHGKLAEPAAKHPCHASMANADDQDNTQNQCSTCQACHLVSASPVQLHTGLLHTTAAPPQQRPTQWRSADVRLLAKTPVF